MKAKKLLVLGLCMALIASISITATLAYLTSSDEVTNTFTVGKVAITLDEADVKPDGTLESTIDTRVDANEYKLYPGRTYIKDPIVHVDSESEECWLYVTVNNGISAIETKDTTKTIATQMTACGWTAVDGATIDGQQVYAYQNIVAKGTNVTVFNNFTIDGSVTNDTLAAYATKDNDAAKIVIKAYAIQADGFTTAAAAWSANAGKF